MTEGYDEGLKLVLALARELREEFGVGIDAHPGGEGIEAGAVNRAFRVVAMAILVPCGTEEDDPATVLTHVLREAARQRLTELGIGPEDAETWISSESKLGDRWLAYLALAPGSLIVDLER